MFAVLLVSLSIHEAAHAWAADMFGDPTARQLGRLTLNPVKHIDPIGTLLLIQRIRDEAHRFAVTFHRARRTKRDLTSELEGIPGIGPGRRRALLRTFGSLSGVRRATREELTKVVGTKAADAVLGFFANA